jgi:hypothetical protein
MLKRRACRRIYVDIVRTVGAVNSVATLSTLDSCNYLLFPMVHQPLVGQDLLTNKVSRSHSFGHTPVPVAAQSEA